MSTHEEMNRAIKYFKSGDKQKARQLLLNIMNSDPGNVDALYGLYLCSADTNEQRLYLEKVLQLDPRHNKASQAMVGLASKDSTQRSSKKLSIFMVTLVSLSMCLLFFICGGAAAFLVSKSNLLAIIPVSDQLVVQTLAIEEPISTILVITLPPTFTPTPTSPPTTTWTPTNTLLPTDTSTPFPTVTREIGTFRNPVPIGTTITRQSDPSGAAIMSATLLEVQRGEAAKELAYSKLDCGYGGASAEYSVCHLLSDQEFIATRVRLEWIDGDKNEVESIYPYWSLTLRYDDAGSDVWSQNDLDLWAEGYVPLSGEDWVFFKVRIGSNPVLYFHPLLIVTETIGIRTHGAYFSLNQ